VAPSIIPFVSFIFTCVAAEYFGLASAFGF